MNPARAARREAAGEQTERWTPPVLQSVASRGEGVTEVLGALDRHFRYLEASGELRERRRARLRERVQEIVEQKVRQRLWSDPDTVAWLAERLPGMESGAETPFGVADALLARSGALLSGPR
jgi:LAO/AO transport system kinase